MEIDKSVIEIIKKVIPELETVATRDNNQWHVFLGSELKRVGIDIHIPLKFVESASKKEIAQFICQEAISNLSVYIDRIIDFHGKFVACEYVLQGEN